MAKTLAGAIDGLGVMLATLSGSGLKRVHGDPPESLSEFPAAVIYALEGRSRTCRSEWGAISTRLRWISTSGAR